MLPEKYSMKAIQQTFCRNCGRNCGRNRGLAAELNHMCLLVDCGEKERGRWTIPSPSD